MKVRPLVPGIPLQAFGCSIVIAGALLLGGAAEAQGSPNLTELKLQLEKQKLALQEAIADREATSYRVREIKSMLSESEADKSEIEKELKMLCDEKEALQPGTLEDCMTSSNN